MLAVRLDLGKHSESQLRPPLAQSQCLVTSGHTASDATARQSSCANISDQPNEQVDTQAVPNIVYRQHTLSKKVKTPLQCAHSGKLLLLLGANYVQIGHDFQTRYVFGQRKAAEPVELRTASFSCQARSKVHHTRLDKHHRACVTSHTPLHALDAAQ